MRRRHQLLRVCVVVADDVQVGCRDMWVVLFRVSTQSWISHGEENQVQATNAR